jgi:hypothetical protein
MFSYAWVARLVAETENRGLCWSSVVNRRKITSTAVWKYFSIQNTYTKLLHIETAVFSMYVCRRLQTFRRIMHHPTSVVETNRVSVCYKRRLQDKYLFISENSISLLRWTRVTWPWRRQFNCPSFIIDCTGIYFLNNFRGPGCSPLPCKFSTL